MQHHWNIARIPVAIVALATLAVMLVCPLYMSVFRNRIYTDQRERVQSGASSEHYISIHWDETDTTLKWMNSEEVLWRGTMYEVVSTEHQENGTLLVLLPDERETSLQTLAKRFGESSKESAKNSFTLTLDWYQPEVPVLPVPHNNNLHIISSVRPPVTLQGFLSIATPPPKKHLVLSA